MIPPRDPNAPIAQEVERLRAIASGSRPSTVGVRVRRVGDGMLGWLHGSSIYSDAEPRVQLFAYWRTYTEADQEDLGLPSAAWMTGDGHWTLA